MQVSTVQNEVVRSNVGLDTAFTIKANARSFEILSSNYSNKILAIVRELACNAYDAHVDAGKKDVPIKIKLPTDMDSTFFVEDYGTGLSHEQVLKLYTTYFESTKTDSNDFIGALGLGSKSPFSYVNNFVVESRHEGMRRTYCCFKNEDGIPSISQLGEMETDAPNGLTVSLAVKSADHSAFGHNASVALQYFDVVPEVLGGYYNHKPVSYIMEGSNWKIRTQSNDVRGVRVVQGLISYPVDLAMLVDNYEHLRYVDVDLFVPIGDVEVAISREALLYNKTTINNLKRTINQFQTEIEKDLTSQIAACPDLLSASQKWSSFVRSSSNANFGAFIRNYLVVKGTTFKWNGMDLGAVLSVDIGSGTADTVVAAYIRSQSRRGASRPTKIQQVVTGEDKVLTVAIDAKCIIVVDHPKYSVTVLRELIRTHSVDKQVVVIQPTSKSTYNETEINGIVDKFTELGFKEDQFVYVSTSGIKSSYQYIKKDPCEVLVWAPIKSPESFSRTTWSHTMVDFDAKVGYYVVVDRFTPKGYEYPSRFAAMVNAVRAIGVIGEDDLVYGITNKQATEIGKTNWINLETAIQAVGKTIDATTLKRQVITNRSKDVVPEKLYKNLTASTTKLADGKMKEFIDGIAVSQTGTKMEQNCIDATIAVLRHLGMWDAISKEIEDQVDGLPAAWSHMIETTYPLISIIDWYNIGNPAVVDYINLVDNG